MSLIIDKHLILLIMVNSRVGWFNSCTHSLDLRLHFFLYNIESISSNIVCSFQPIFMFLLNFFFSSKTCLKSKSRLSFFNLPSFSSFKSAFLRQFHVSLSTVVSGLSLANCPCILLFFHTPFFLLIQRCLSSFLFTQLL